MNDAIRPVLLAALIAPLLSGCIPQPAGEYVEQGQMVQNRADGVLVNQEHVDLVTRWRAPMDHGGTEQADRIAFRLWEARFDGDAATIQRHPVGFVWDRGTLGYGDDDGLKNPSFVRVNGRHVPNGCYGATLSGVDATGTTCRSPTDAPQVVQTGGRAERMIASGSRLTFADGLDGHAAPCTLDLHQIAADADQPLTTSIYAANPLVAMNDHPGDETAPAYRFAVSYLPPATAFVVDYGRPTLPIYRATCAGFRPAGAVLPLASGVIRAGSERNRSGVSMLDMVADPGQAQPALFLAVPDTDYGHRLVVIRAGKAPQIIPYFCHDCLPNVAGFFRSDPDWLLYDARLQPAPGSMTVALSLFDVRGNREVTRRLRVADPQPWPAR